MKKKKFNYVFYISNFVYFIFKIFVRLLILSINDDNQRLVRKSLDILVVREISYFWACLFLLACDIVHTNTKPRSSTEIKCLPLEVNATDLIKLLAFEVDKTTGLEK